MSINLGTEENPLIAFVAVSGGYVDAVVRATDLAAFEAAAKVAELLYEVMETVTGGADPADGQLGTFWTEEFEEVFGEELTWVAGFVPFEDTVETGCGPLGGGTAAYCIEDEKIYYDEAWLLALHELLGEPGPVLGLAHEVGHHIAAARGPRPEPVAADIQADCFAGVFFDAAYDGPGLAPGEISGPTAASFVVGARAEPDERRTPPDPGPVGGK